MGLFLRDVLDASFELLEECLTAFSVGHDICQKPFRHVLFLSKKHLFLLFLNQLELLKSLALQEVFPLLVKILQFPMQVGKLDMIVKP